MFWASKRTKSTQNYIKLHYFCIIMHYFYSKYAYNIILDHLATFRNFRFFRHFGPPKIHIRDPQTQFSPRDPPKSESSVSFKRLKNTKLSAKIKNKLSRSIQKSFLYNICSNEHFSPLKQKVRTLFYYFSVFSIIFKFFSGRQWCCLFRFGFGGKQ